MGAMEFGLLGPLMVRRDKKVIPVRRGNQRVVLVTLLLKANQVVSADEIAETLWGAAPPPSAQVTIRNYVRRLRVALGDTSRTRISTQPRGYLISIADGELDVSRFEVLLGSARAAAREGAWDQAAGRARAALSLWRGEPLADVESETLAMRELPSLVEMRLQALETLFDADLYLGRHADVIAALQHLADAYPLREHLHALLMLALYRCGRQAEALAAYQQTRRMLVDEIGAEPGAELRDLHGQVLAAAPDLHAPEPAPRLAGGSPPAVPRELPPAPAHFTGRADELAALTGMLDQVGRTRGMVVISAIGGIAGVGKTALAVYWAHQVAPHFPDGQLYANLRGFDPSGAPAAPAETIRGFLDALGVPADRIPPGLAAQVGLYRSKLADRQVLIVLDNASDERQVRPLLPASPGCLVLLTSRNQLAGLAAAEGARLIILDVLADDQARELLTWRIGGRRAEAEPGAVGELARLCGRLPLALTVAAARAATRPAMSLAAVAAGLAGTASRLEALHTGDPLTDVRTVFSWSCQHLGPEPARLFRLLGIHPGPDITAPATAALLGHGQDGARAALDSLAMANLATEHVPGRYCLHDLLRAYAAEQATAHETEAERQGAIQRVLDYYLHTSHAAALLLNPKRVLVLALPPTRPGVAPGRLGGHQQALAWFEAEHQVLLGCVSLAAETGSDACAWILPWAMTEFLDRRGHWHEWAATQHAALAAATRLGDVAGQAVAHRAIATACIRLADYRQARGHLAACLQLRRQLGDRAGEALTRHTLGRVAEHQGRYADALRHEQQALSLFRDAADQAGEALALNAIGWYHLLLGRPEQARTFCRQALAVYRHTGYRVGQAQVWDSLGYAEYQLGRLDQATSYYQHALDILRDLGELFGQADTLTRLGDTRAAAADLPAAQHAWQQALDILEDLRHPDATQVRAKLRGTALSPRPPWAAAESGDKRDDHSEQAS
jgi:DNA-binding SARP family transcriptional activator/Tfp pilus assembly protein PilF